MSYKEKDEILEHLEEKYGIIHLENIAEDNDGLFMITHIESDSEQGGVAMDIKKTYFDHEDVELLKQINLI